jgi:hypothetical protein
MERFLGELLFQAMMESMHNKKSTTADPPTSQAVVR